MTVDKGHLMESLSQASVSDWEALEQLAQQPDQNVEEFVQEFEASCSKVEAGSNEARLPDRYKTFMLFRRLRLSDRQKLTAMGKLNSCSQDKSSLFDHLKACLIQKTVFQSEPAAKSELKAGHNRTDCVHLPPELVEQVCGRLDGKSLIAARSVCRTYRDVVHRVCKLRNRDAYSREQLEDLCCCLPNEDDRRLCGCLEACVGFAPWNSRLKVPVLKDV